MENELYRQAILDAKAVRASAIANAKASLQEAFEPAIQEMLRMKLSEELEEDLEENYEEGAAVEEGMPGEGVHEEGYEMTSEELDEILAELEAMEEGEGVEEDVEEGYERTEESLNEAEEAEEEEEEPAMDEPEGEEPKKKDDEMEVTIKFGDLKDVLAPFVTKAEEGGEGEEGEGEEGESEEGEGTPEDTLSLDEILAELEEADTEEGKEHMEEKKTISGFGHGSTEAPKTGATNWKTVKQLHEANKTIEVLSEKLQEINLLNAKLLYMNKIFKAKNLNESQKINVVKSFDKAASVKEVKNVYEILSESLSTKKKTSINESRGFASKPAGVAPKTPIVDSDPTVDRWQQLVFGRK